MPRPSERYLRRSANDAVSAAPAFLSLTVSNTRPFTDLTCVGFYKTPSPTVHSRRDSLYRLLSANHFDSFPSGG
ncbi:hypothetical protein EVAR_61444_1 [Eumeta japonica]|uniref:Uncharacterized protein n=1 Tax=Eumeta variegata TaxID=151549 RepID=A0A4C1YYT6_EUMVA|nr:hypothetical protein EVAR_61444_1 [Eumeta japonica]